MTFEFRVGDIVEFGGLRGEVKVVKSHIDRPVLVAFNESTLVSFCIDGRYLPIHTKPLLVLVERPKKRIEE